MNPSEAPVVGLGEVLWDLFPSGRVLGERPSISRFTATSLVIAP